MEEHRTGTSANDLHYISTTTNSFPLNSPTVHLTRSSQAISVDGFSSNNDAEHLGISAKKIPVTDRKIIFFV
ncbi:hypothetical protein [Haliscomenobacter hydrossis]|uniref:Uncharacterized protein n=1 Tax=Haliscomenobacter hydrossis (strain ATCC 27775 / DSM 1100 / LMG 10767 / O) TaxID=760192 RepID=F4L393_HALH1|nr:hypothetical protein [Haliscomenobacter hydrossis]AEE51727.1 hypothetical protein Halhy_3876 [Haliscomenobacter hydrossis DSM 1100]